MRSPLWTLWKGRHEYQYCCRREFRDIYYSRVVEMSSSSLIVVVVLERAVVDDTCILK